MSGELLRDAEAGAQYRTQPIRDGTACNIACLNLRNVVFKLGKGRNQDHYKIPVGFVFIAFKAGQRHVRACSYCCVGSNCSARVLLYSIVLRLKP